MGIFTEEIAIDLGTANTLIIHNDKVVINSPSIVAIDRTTNKIIAIGDEANIMQGKTHENIKTVRPLKDGVIADFEASEQMISTLIKSIPTLKKRWFSPSLTMVICIPSGITEVEMRAVKESAERVNGKEVYLIHEPMAAAIGIGIDIVKPKGNMVVDIGGGTTEIAVISLNGIGALETINTAGDEQTESIVQWFKDHHKLAIGERTAEEIKCTVGSAVRTSGKSIAVKGLDLITGIPKTVQVSSDEIRQALSETVYQITAAIKRALDKTPPEHASDLIDFGIIMTGGDAQLKGLDEHIKNKTGLPVHVAEDPCYSVVKGTGIVLDSLKKFQNVLIQP